MGHKPFSVRRPGRPAKRVSAKEKARQRKLQQLVQSLAGKLGEARYAVVTANLKLWGAHVEFSGRLGAKAALDSSDLPVGSAVVRLCDGVELARRSKVGEGFAAA